MKQLLLKYGNFASKPQVLALSLPLTILAARLVWAYYPDYNSPDRVFARQLQAAMKNDPPVGIDTGLAAYGIKKNTIVLYVAKCNCYHDNLVFLESNQSKEYDVRVMMMEDASTNDIKKTFAKHSSLLLFDKEKQVGKRINLAFVPRIFVTDRQGRLLWLYNDYNESWPELLSHAKAFLEDKS